MNRKAYFAMTRHVSKVHKRDLSVRSPEEFIRQYFKGYPTDEPIAYVCLECGEWIDARNNR